MRCVERVGVRAALPSGEIVQLWMSRAAYDRIIVAQLAEVLFGWWLR